MSDTDFNALAREHAGSVPAGAIDFGSVRIGGLELYESPSGTLAVGIKNQDANSNANVSQTTSNSTYRVLTGAHGETVTEGWVSEEITLATDALTTDSVANLLPANAVILGGTWLVTAAITGDTITVKFGDGSTADRFADAVGTTALALGQSGYFANIFNPAKAAGYTPYQAAAAKLRITATSGSGFPLTGKVRVSIAVRIFGAPTS